MPKSIKALYLPKRYGTYADTFLTLGLAQFAEYVLGEAEYKKGIQITDDGTKYRLEFKQEIDLERIAAIDYFSLFPPVVGNKTDRSNIPQEITPFDAVKKAEERKLYRDYIYQGGKRLDLGDDAPPPPDAKTQNAVILTSMRHDRNHNGLWEEGWKISQYFGDLVAAIFQGLGEEDGSIEQVGEIFKQRTKEKLPNPASSVKIFMPTAVQGVNRVKTDINKADSSQKEDWLILWLIAAGLFAFGIAERVKVGESSYDWRVVALEPKDISLNDYQSVLDNLRKYNPPGGGHGVARFDAELVLKFTQQLLNNHSANEEEQTRRRKSIKSFVTGFKGSHFGSKGQVYGVKEVFSLGLPDWIHLENRQDVTNYLVLIQEHLSVIQSLSAEEGHSELLAAYRDFITGNELELFFRFQRSYADFVVRQLADPKARNPRLFSQEGLNIMTQSFYRPKDEEWSIKDITENPGFLRIARAINSSTVYAGKIQTKAGPKELDWQRQYGLAQRLTSQAGSKKDFIIELTTFLALYENENLRIKEQLQKDGKTLKRISPTNEDLDEVMGLIETFGSSLVANLLVAYGYSIWKKPLKEEPPDTSIQVDDSDNSDDSNIEN